MTPAILTSSNRSNQVLRATGAFVLALACLQIAACRSQIYRSPEDIQREEDAKPHQGVRILPGADTDEASAVLSACGEPSVDRILAVYNRKDSGPIRRMIYAGTQQVTLDFIPSLPLVRQSGAFNHAVMRPELPQGAVWLFDEGRVEREELLTSKRLAAYLPCAARAIHR